MLRDAALLTLDVLCAALAEGMTLKDASSYNVQFRGASPQFIDLGSFEAWREGEPWVGYRQFCQLFLYPLMLQAYKGIAFQPWLRGAVDGITPEEMAGLSPPVTWCAAACWRTWSFKRDSRDTLRARACAETSPLRDSRKR